MFEKLRRSKLMYWSLEALIVALLLIALSHLSFLVAPIAAFFSTLLVPLITAGFLYYLFNPLVKLLGRLHIPRGAAIALVFVAVLSGFVLIVAAIIPNLVNQVTQLITGLPDFLVTLRAFIHRLARYQWYQQFDVESVVAKLKVQPSTLLNQVLGNFSSGLPGLIGSVAAVVVNVITVPVVLFYMLKDGDRLVPAVQRLLPGRYQQEVATVFSRMNQTLSHYIAGQAIECLFVGTFTFIGYLLIGLPYAFLLGFVAGVFTIVPYLGPYLGIAPALAVAATTGWGQVALVIVVVLIVQQTDGNLIYPNVIGRSLDIHPLTIIVLLLVAGNLYGIMGTILAVPVYAVAKTVVSYALELYAFHRTQRKKAQLLGAKLHRP
ncbi:AI-2E family transporter [Lacticaseibacillus parakribbianus]|uniref:AI-2E family transporter n=1 Tax=Lacticaseibacillus parakribbianus TaxID=2970927 RepID=UPI0021CB3C62|nr:AI-2E family transporter [Lacticaseibacillus parakribbianus]